MSMVTGRPLIKGFIGRVDSGALVNVLNFQFNPTELTHTRSPGWEYSGGPGSPMPHAFFKSCEGDSLSFQLLFDASAGYAEEREGTGAQKAYIEALTHPDIDAFQSSIGQFVAPPLCRFGLGHTSFPAVVAGCTFRDTRFGRNGVPTRTYVDMQLRVVLDDIASYRARLDRLSYLRGLVSAQVMEV